MIRRNLASILTILLLAVAGALVYLQQQGVPVLYQGVHGLLLWVEILLVPLTLIMTAAVLLANTRRNRRRD